MEDLLDKIKGWSWWTILKALAFEGGPSSTKWVYLAMNAVLAIVLLGMTGTVCWRYARTGTADSSMLLAIGSVITVISACATNAMNYRRKLNAQIQTDEKPLADAPTPVTMQQPEEKQ